MCSSMRMASKLLSPEYVSDHFRWRIAHSDLPKIRFHDLRHTCCDTCSSHEGCSLREIQSYLGHASYLTTTRYAPHRRPQQRARARDRRAQVLNVDQGQLKREFFSLFFSEKEDQNEEKKL